MDVAGEEASPGKTQLFRGRLATASRFPPRKLARCPHNVVPHVVHVVSSLEFRHGFLVGA